jgi:SH3 domain-containing YSC84-like protein 1
VFSGKAGSGIVIARLPDGSWSAPSCIATGGMGWGLQIGADITDFVVVLNSEDAVRAFSMGGNVTIGGNISAAAGPVGTGGSVQASLAHPAPMFSYSKSKGQSIRSVFTYTELSLKFIGSTRSLRWHFSGGDRFD